MPTNSRLLKHLRHAATTMLKTTPVPEHRTLLAATDVVLNELLLREDPTFYLDYLARGRALLAEGGRLAGMAVDGIGVGKVDASASYACIEREIEHLHDSLLPVVDVLDEDRSPAEKDYLVRVSAWEAGLYQHRLEEVDRFEDAPAITAETLLAYLQKKCPTWRDLRVTSFVVLDGGFSKQTILFETEDTANGHQSLVMRAEQSANLCCYDGSEVTQEFYMIKLMQQAGLPVAEPLWLESDTNHLGTRFIISRKAVGKTYGGNFGSDEPLAPELLNSILDTFFAMHNIRVDPNDPLAQQSHLREWLGFRTVGAATHHYVDVFMPEVLRRCDIRMTPQLRRGLNWLVRNVPACDEPPAVLHIDYAFNNLILDDRQVTAVLDWESSRLGDPAEDIIWTQLSLAAQVPMPEFLVRYRAATGREVTPFRIAYARVAKCALNAISIHSALRLLEKNDTAQLKLGILGLKYMAPFGANFNELIEAAEKVRER